MAAPDSEAPAVRRQPEKALASEKFTRSERLSRSLRFVVERHLEGRDDELKESVIALEVFGSRNYDPRQDSNRTQRGGEVACSACRGLRGGRGRDQPLEARTVVSPLRA